MPEMLNTSAIMGADLGKSVALITDGSFWRFTVLLWTCYTRSFDGGELLSKMEIHYIDG
jgi:hypothetical protein